MVTFNHDADGNDVDGNDGDDDGDDEDSDDGGDDEHYNDECRFSFILTLRTWSNIKVDGGIDFDFHDGDGDFLDTGNDFDEGDDLDDDDEDLVGHVQEGLGIHGGACSSSSEKTPFKFHFFEYHPTIKFH